MINSYENVKDRVFLVLTRTIGYHIIYINGIKVYEGSSKILEEVEITDQFRKDESNIFRQSLGADRDASFLRTYTRALRHLYLPVYHKHAQPVSIHLDAFLPLAF